MQKMPIIMKRKSAKSQYSFSSSLYRIYGCIFKYVFKRCSPLGLKQCLKGAIFLANSKECNTWKVSIWFILKGSHESFQLIGLDNISYMNTTVAGQKKWNPFRFFFPFHLGSEFHRMYFVTRDDVVVTRKSVLLSFQ